MTVNFRWTMALDREHATDKAGGLSLRIEAELEQAGIEEVRAYLRDEDGVEYDLYHRLTDGEQREIEEQVYSTAAIDDPRRKKW